MARHLYGCRAGGNTVRKGVGTASFLLLGALLGAFCAVIGPAHAQDYGDSRYRVTPVRSAGGLLGFLFGGPGDRRGEDDSSAPRGGYRTLCVRLCDGYYWPLSFSTGRTGLTRDAERCASSCKSPARLFYHHSSGSAENMIDLEGQPYAGLEHAFRYRAEYVADCACKPEPWSEEAKLEYAARAETGPAEDAPPAGAEQPVAGFAPEPASRTYVAPASARARPSPRVIEAFNPFGRWFN